MSSYSIARRAMTPVSPVPSPTTGPASSVCSVSDADAVRRVQSGDAEAFGILMERYEGVVFALALRLLQGDREAASDAAQEAFVSAWRGLAQYDTARPFRPWMCRIAVNSALKVRRGAQPVESLEGRTALADVQDSRARNPRDHAQASESIDQLEAALRQLPPESAAMLELFHREELSLDEIGAAFGKPAGTIAVTLCRARKKVREFVRRESNSHEMP